MTLKPRDGAASSRVNRFKSAQGTVNAMGFLGEGATPSRSGWRIPPSGHGPTIVSIFTSTTRDVLMPQKRLSDWTDVLEFNPSCAKVAWGPGGGGERADEKEAEQDQ